MRKRTYLYFFCCYIVFVGLGAVGQKQKNLEHGTVSFQGKEDNDETSKRTWKGMLSFRNKLPFAKLIQRTWLKVMRVSKAKLEPQKKKVGSWVAFIQKQKSAWYEASYKRGMLAFGEDSKREDSTFRVD